MIVDDDHVSQDGRRTARSTHERKPRKPDEHAEDSELVAAAVGLDTERGDQLTVENIAFDEPPVERAVAGRRCGSACSDQQQSATAPRSSASCSCVALVAAASSCGR